MKNDVPNIPNYLHISDPNLLYYKFHHIVINFITRLRWYFEINLRRLLLEDFFCILHIAEYVCKTCLKEVRQFKCRQTFEKFRAACNSSKNTRVPQFFFKGFWQLYFKNINFLKKLKRCLCAEFYEFKTKMTWKDKQNHIF